MSMASSSPFRYVYLHGWLSGPQSFKGTFLKDKLSPLGIDLQLIDLNRGKPPGQMTYDGALIAVDEVWEREAGAHGEGEVKLRLIGSSLGGYFAARYAELHPNRVDRMVLLCPAFDFHNQFRKLTGENTVFGPPDMDGWQSAGSRPFPMPDGSLVDVPFSFVDGARGHHAFPLYLCPTTIIHGLDDEIIPVDTTKQFWETHEDQGEVTSLLLVPDQHALTAPNTLSLTLKTITDFFRLSHTNKQQQQQQQQDQAPPPAAAAAAVAAAMIEVERKFPMLDESDLERAIEREGGQLVGEQAFVDTYFDWEGYPLTLHNCWLRRRAGLWELKTPRGVTKEGGDQYSGHEGEGRLAIFEEELDEDKIVQYLKTHFADHMTSDDLKTAVAEETPGGGTRAGLQAFCHYGTNRRKYVAGDPAITIDVDSASFGYGCVELERMCVSDEETAAATRDIDSMAKRLNLASSIAQTGEHAPAPQSAPQPSADGRKLSLGLPSSGPLSLGIPLRGEPESPPPRGVGGGLPLGSQGGPHRAAMSVQRGKLEEWIRRYSPQHFDLLKDAKIFQ
ncbi:unnamed protein product [Vitrella brassicaformis CCMP3155]|uniref:CYTH domain-containing protein n=2 Tax=Vitrella brassicaformis TaxID=1169539 RepID=A0A0G4EN47_VITBC|nr:unnamed protein product [Vitrella brassicaformis CCMP3155]|eukprot:CEL98256.1 unnamed protein product [Vitrella brassicaformis CCMP3155]